MPVAKNPQSGFSLVELLVAIVILAVGLLGLAELQVTAMKSNSQSATSTAATALAQRIIEEVAAMDASDPLFDGASTGTWPGSPITTLEGGGIYNITYSVAPVLSDPGAGTVVSNLYQVTVTVTSSTELMHVLGNRARQVTATTLKRAT